MSKLAKCPCGERPNELFVYNNGQETWATVKGDCCDTWGIDFRTKNYDLESKDCMELAIKAWNYTKRS